MSIHTNINQNFNSVSTSTNIFGNANLKITFKKGIHSVNLSNQFFNNHFDRTDKIYIKFAKSEFKKFKNNDLDVLEEYNDKFIGFKKKDKKRFLDIYLQTYGYKYQIPFLKRLTKIGNERFQLFYCYIKNNDMIEIIFIDLYHMLVPAADKDHGEKVKDLQKNYYSHAKADLDLKEFIN